MGIHETIFFQYIDSLLTKLFEFFYHYNDVPNYLYSIQIAIIIHYFNKAIYNLQKKDMIKKDLARMINKFLIMINFKM